MPLSVALDDCAPLRLVVERGATALATIVGIEGSFSRAVGAQLAIASDGTLAGSLADTCLEAALVREAEAAFADGAAHLLRYGRGSPFIDIRLPCGGGLDILLDPAPDRVAIGEVLRRIDRREAASLNLPLPGGAPLELIKLRRYKPPARLIILGEGPEVEALAVLSSAMGLPVEARSTRDPGMALGRAPEGLAVDPWTAIILLFHDHEWERAILPWALGTSAFFVGAQGGAPARAERDAFLSGLDLGAAVLAKLKSPIGLIPHARDPQVLALSVLAEVVGAYEGMKG